MRIKVITKHFIIVKPGTNKVPQTVHFDREEEFFFNYIDGYVLLEGSGFKKKVNNLEECFKTIKSFFNGSNYEIVDFVQMIV